MWRRALKPALLQSPLFLTWWLLMPSVLRNRTATSASSSPVARNALASEALQ